MKTNKTQILARLVWASNLGCAANAQPQMVNALNGLIRRGLIGHNHHNLQLTDDGMAMMAAAGIPTSEVNRCADGMARDLVPSALYWTDSWGQIIPC